jgi:hypothetical protein
MKEYYIWDTESEAQTALNFINGTNWFPLTGNNALTGEPEPDKQKTSSWTDSVLESNVDGKWGFKRVSVELMDFAGVPAEDRQAFLDTFNPSIEERDPSEFAEELSDI